ncbi:MAG TPA: hypothetical protein VG476_04545 [Acidimicrobiales bacterium]|nr:hypothetical protein [Acidimicrobiales bacterium]
MNEASRAVSKRSVTVTITGCPPNWSQWRGSSLRRDLAKKVWRDQMWVLAQSARNAARWPLPDDGPPFVRRYLSVVVRKAKPFMDDDGVVSALKPLIDGLKGVLVVDDSPRWCALVTPPYAIQHPVTRRQDERVEITVHLDMPAAIGEGS